MVNVAEEFFTFFHLAISILISIPLFVSIYQCYKKGISSNKLNVFLRLGSIAGFSFTQFMLTVMLIISNQTTITNLILECISNTLWLSSEFMLIIYFINRFYYAFIDHPHCQLSNTTYNILYCGASLYLLVQLVSSINIFCIYFDIYDIRQAMWFEIIYDIISILIDTSLNCYILYSFTLSIVHLISNTNNNALNVNEEENKLLDTVTKYFVLLSFSIISSLIVLVFCIIACIHSLWKHETAYFLYPPNDYGAWNKVINYLWPLDCLCNAYCLFFERDYAKKYYNVCCLSLTKIHCCTKRMFTRLTTHTLRARSFNDQNEPLNICN